MFLQYVCSYTLNSLIRLFTAIFRQTLENPLPWLMLKYKCTVYKTFLNANQKEFKQVQNVDQKSTPENVNDLAPSHVG